MWREPSTEWHLRQPWSAATRAPLRRGWTSPRDAPLGAGERGVLGPGLAAALVGQPGVELGGRHHHQLGQHAGVGEAAVLGAEDLVAAGRARPGTRSAV